MEYESDDTLNSENNFSKSIKHCDLGFELFMNGNYLEALKNFNISIQLNNQNHLAYYRRAVIHVNREDFTFAIDDLDKAISLQPKDKEYYFGRGYAKLKVGNRVESKKDFEISMELGHPEARLMIKTNFKDESNEINEIMNSAIKAYNEKNISASRAYLIRIYNHICQNPTEISKINSLDILSDNFYLMSRVGITDDIDNKQIMSSLGYLITTLALNRTNSRNILLLRNRLMIMRNEDEALGYSVVTANNLGGKFVEVMFSGRDPQFEARNILWAMEVHDLKIEPTLLTKYDLFNKWFREHEVNILEGAFHPNNSIDSVVKLGEKHHSTLFNYLNNKVIERGDLDFDKP